MEMPSQLNSRLRLRRHFEDNETGQIRSGGKTMEFQLDEIQSDPNPALLFHTKPITKYTKTGKPQ